MSSASITCTNCGQSISLDEALTHQLEEKLRKELSVENSVHVEKRIKEAEEAIRDKAAAQFRLQREESTKKLEILEREKEEQSRKLQQMADQELKLRQEKNAIEERERQLALEVQRQVDEQKQALRQSISKEIEEQSHFQVAQKEKQIEDLRKQLGEAQRVAQQGSQQSQGEVLELELENLLMRLCPHDTILPVGKGVNGADLIQVVNDRFGNQVGKIVWELKNTKAWSPGWVAKLKDDQRREKAEIAVIISTVLPESIKGFGFMDGIWVGSLTSVTGLAAVLRGGLLEIAAIKSQGENKQDKMEVVYQYLNGVAFSQRVHGVVESLVEMQNNLQKEKRTYTKMWETREKLLEKSILGISGFWGELEGLMGPTLPKMDLLSLEEADEDDEAGQLSII